jgi:prepilin-type N-terminal cleavage/methylation domain-containing protein
MPNVKSQICNLKSEIQNGYTLVELLVVMGLITIVTGVLVTVIYQFYTVTSLGNAQLAVDADLRNAGLWLMRDGNQSAVFTQTGTCGVFAAPTFIGSTRYITYTFSAGTLNRRDSGTPGQVIGVARRLAAPPTCSVQGQSAVILLTSATGQVSNSATFTVTLRVH